MKKREKSKTLKSHSKTPPAGPELPELVTIMMKVAERLDALEKKTDLVMGQLTKFAFSHEFVRPPALSVPAARPFQQPLHAAGLNGMKVQSSQGQGPARRERALHQAVCADCHKHCEVPFKPTGERPVYCKECFARRKAVRSAKGNQVLISAKPPLTNPQRHVLVTKKGVGKVTVSEIVHSSKHGAHKKKSHNPASKSKR